MISVLFVDDEISLLNLGKILLEKSENFLVTTVNSANGAIFTLKNQKFDAIVSDYKMPGMNGIDLLKIVRDQYGDLPFILFTGKGREQIVIDAINNGADFYIQKSGDTISQFAELAQKIIQSVNKIQVDKSFHDSEKRRAEIIDFLPYGTFAIDRSGFVIAWNRAIEEMTGIRSEEMIGKGDFEYAIPFYGTRRPLLIDFIYEKDEKIEQFYTNITRDRDSITAETNLLNPKGKQLYGLVKACPLYNPEGDVIGAVESISDISGKKIKEIALKESENKFRSFVESSPDMIYRMSIPDEKFEYISPASLSFTGFKPEDFYSDLKLFKRLIHPKCIDYFQKEWNNLLIGVETPIYEYQIIDREGKPRWFNQRNRLIKDESGRSVALEGIVTDITLKKNIEHELWKSEQRVLAVTKNAGFWIWEVDPDGIYRYSSSVVEQILGYKPEELLGKVHFYDLFDPSVREELKKSVMDTFSSRKFFHDLVHLNRHKNGDPVILNTSGMPIFDEFGIFLGYCGVDEDITLKKKTEESLRKANNQLNLLSSLTRHDILNKIAVILGYLAVAEMEFEDPELLNYIERMKNATIAIKNQIEFTRVYQNLGTQDPQWLKPEELIPRSTIPDTVILTSDIHGVTILADPLLEDALFNLLDNSIRHGVKVNKIQLSYYQLNGILILVWEDNGIGIPDANKELIFERGFGNNNGLGLFLVREILSLTNITIKEVGRSEAGARFEISVPKGGWKIEN